VLVAQLASCKTSQISALNLLSTSKRKAHCEKRRALWKQRSLQTRYLLTGGCDVALQLKHSFQKTNTYFHAIEQQM